jgi:hypothetical protein
MKRYEKWFIVAMLILAWLFGWLIVVNGKTNMENESYKTLNLRCLAREVNHYRTFVKKQNKAHEAELKAKDDEIAKRDAVIEDNNKTAKQIYEKLVQLGILQITFKRANSNPVRTDQGEVISGPQESTGDVNPYYGGPRFVSHEFVYDLAVKYSYCGWDPNVMVRIVFEQETHSGDTMADNGSGCWGLLQCNSDYLTREELWNPDKNFEIGAQKYVGAGHSYSPWNW